jgi:hypothetical protein
MEQPVSSGHTFSCETETQATCRSHDGVLRQIDANTSNPVHDFLYERVPFATVFVWSDRQGWAASLYPGLLQLVLPLRPPMKSADPHLIPFASSTLWKSFRFSESRSYLACHHIRLLRNLSTFIPV